MLARIKVMLFIISAFHYSSFLFFRDIFIKYTRYVLFWQPEDATF